MQEATRGTREEHPSSLSWFPCPLPRFLAVYLFKNIPMDQRQWTAVMVLGATVVSIGAVVIATALSVGAVFGIKALFIAIISILKLATEIAIALIAALTSGSTISLSVITAVWASALTVPASHIEMRVIVAIGVASLSLASAAAVLVIFGVIESDKEFTGAVTCAAAVAVSVAAGWAVGVLSLIEKETQQVGIGMTSILDAVKNNNFILLRLLLSFHRDVRQREMERALIHAVKANYPECCRALLTNGADPDACDAHGNTALLNAAENGFYKIVKLLLDAGCHVDNQSNSRGTALHHAAKWGHVNCVELLLARGADPDIRDGFWRTPLILAAKDAADPLSVMHVLVEARCSVNTMGVEKKSVLHYACTRGLEIEFLLNAKAETKVTDDEGNTPLHQAALSGHVHCLKSLLCRGSGPNVFNFSRRTPLHLSCMKDNTACSSELVSHGANVNAVDSDGHSPIWFSIVNGHAPSVGTLLRANASLKQQYTSASEDSLLRLALERCHYLTAKYMIIFGLKTGPLDQWFTNQLAVRDASDGTSTEVIGWFKRYISAPPNLCHLCRLCVRKSMAGKPYRYLFRLPLPKVLQEYLDYAEFEAET